MTTKYYPIIKSDEILSSQSNNNEKRLLTSQLRYSHFSSPNFFLFSEFSFVYLFIILRIFEISPSTEYSPRTKSPLFSGTLRRAENARTSTPGLETPRGQASQGGMFTREKIDRDSTQQNIFQKGCTTQISSDAVELCYIVNSIILIKKLFHSR